jgi:hypothetical protein
MIWLVSSNGPPFYLDGKKSCQPPGGEDIRSIGLSRSHGIIGFDPSGQLYIYSKESNSWEKGRKLQLTPDSLVKTRSLKTDRNSNFNYIYETLNNNETRNWRLIDINQGIVERVNVPGIFRVVSWSENGFYFIDKNRVLYYNDGTKSQPLNYKDGNKIVAHDIFYTDTNWYFYRYQKDKYGRKLSIKLYCLNERKAPKEVLHLPIQSKVSNLDQDKQGRFWLATNEGLIRANPNVLNFSSKQDKMIKSLHTIGEDQLGNIWFGSYGDGFCYYDGQSLNRPEKQFSPLQQVLPGQYRDKEGIPYFWVEKSGLIRIKNYGWESVPTPKMTDGKRIEGYFFRKLNSNKIALGLYKLGLGIAEKPLINNPQFKIIGPNEGLTIQNVLTVSEDKEGRLWCGHPRNGIGVYDPKRDTAFTWSRNDSLPVDLELMSTFIDDRGTLFLGGRGLHYIENVETVSYSKNDLTKRIKKIDLGKHKDDNVHALSIHKGFLIISGRNGHAFMDLNSFYTQEKPDLFFFDTSDPAQGGAGEQNALYTDSKGYLWIGKDRGALRVDMENLVLDTMPVSIVIDEITAGNEEVALRDGDLLELPTKKRSLQLNVHQSFSGYLNDNVDFRYRINKRNEEEGDFLDVPESGSIRIDYLAPGSYTLDFKAIKNNQISDIRTLSLEVPFLLVEMPLFWIGLIGFFFLAVFIILYFQYQSKYRIKQSELQLSQLEGELDQMQVKAISSALNPHFINNALHWLQSKMRSDKEAVQMIDRISENIRMVFTRSRQGTPFHTLKEELNLVQNYVHVQQIRYGDELKCDIPSPNALNQLASIQIPLMQIQIHMENAIEHGTRNRMGKGWVKLSIDEEANHLHIRVADNGIGREKAREIGSGGTQQGVTMLKNLHRIYNQKNKNKIEFWYDDLPFVDEKTGEKVGTIAHIQIPKDFHYALTST